jgi:hypothetical protein
VSGTSGARQFWICGQCHHHVPARLSACRCGFSRQDVSDIQFATPTGEQVPEGSISGFYVKAKVWDKPCPRCNQPSSVDHYRLAPVWRVGTMVAGLAALAIGLFSNGPYRGFVAPLVSLYSVLMLKVGSRAECHSCGAKLNLTFRGGWA